MKPARALNGRKDVRAVLMSVLGALVLSCSPSSTPSEPGAVASPPVVVVLGDSLTAGPGLRAEETYPALLQQRASAAGYRHRIVNAGVSGDTTADALRRLDRAFEKDATVLVVALGANDGLRHVPIEQVRSNLRQILQRGKEKGLKILLAGMETPPYHGWQYTLDFHHIFPDLAREFDATLMPFLLTGVVGNPDMNLPDGVHPNAAGMRAIANAMWPYLEPLLE
jgi:acyl-CoA thioesterase-1